MPASNFIGRTVSEPNVSTENDGAGAGNRLRDLSKLANQDIETSLVANLSGELHTLFDPVSDGALPISFGPLLGRLYLEGL